MIIYKITNLKNGKAYIGQTIHSLEKRFKEHCKKDRCTAMYSAIQKYGVENFTVEVIENVSESSLLNEREIHWISYFNTMSPNGYNLTSGGMNGRISADSTKEKLASYVRGKTGCNHPSFGHKKSKEWKEKQSLLMRNRLISSETRAKMSLGSFGKKNNVKKCNFVSDNGEKLSFFSLKEAGKHFNVSASLFSYYIRKDKKFKEYKIILGDM